MKNIPETDTISRLSLSGKGWKGSGFPVMGFTLSTWEYLASNWGRSSSWNKRKDLIWCSISLNYQKNQAECDIKKIPDIKLFFFFNNVPLQAIFSLLKILWKGARDQWRREKFWAFPSLWGYGKDTMLFKHQFLYRNW